MKALSPRVHDLLEIDGRPLLRILPPPPAWLNEYLGRHCHVVTRRLDPAEYQIPIGICGSLRNQRFAASIPRTLVKSILTPLQLLRLADGLSRPRLSALKSLVSLKKRWVALSLEWGPIGSVALELATGSRRVNAQSDLDIVVHASDRFTADDAKVIFGTTLGLPAKVDIRVETPFCGFSLFEFGWAHSGNILLRTHAGPILGSDPWDDSLVADAARPIVGGA